MWDLVKERWLITDWISRSANWDSTWRFGLISSQLCSLPVARVRNTNNITLKCNGCPTWCLCYQGRHSKVTSGQGTKIKQIIIHLTKAPMLDVQRFFPIFPNKVVIYCYQSVPQCHENKETCVIRLPGFESLLSRHSQGTLVKWLKASKPQLPVFKRGWE